VGRALHPSCQQILLLPWTRQFTLAFLISCHCQYSLLKAPSLGLTPMNMPLGSHGIRVAAAPDFESLNSGIKIRIPIKTFYSQNEFQ